MVELTDLTLNEVQCDYKKVYELMVSDVSRNWMIISDAFVFTEFISSNFRLHFWKNGDVFIHDTNHPIQMDVSDEDFRELAQWCKHNGWTGLKVDDRLLGNRIALEFWNRMFIAGLVGSDTLQKKEQDEIRRITKNYIIEKENEE